MQKLILLNLPIGNLGDITTRVKDALIKGKNFACEDTRNLKKLMGLYGIEYESKKFLSVHDHNAGNIKQCLDILKTEDLYYCSDAGSPYISDPAYPLVKACLEAEIELESFGGITSPIVALELSGLPPIPFHFHGFLGRDKKHIKDFAEVMMQTPGTHIAFESPHRAQNTLQIISELGPEVNIVMVRELSKMYQTVYRFKGSEFTDQDIMYKGETVLLFNNSEVTVQKSSGENIKLAQDILKKGAKPKLVSKLLASILDKPIKEIYNQLGQGEES